MSSSSGLGPVAIVGTGAVGTALAHAFSVAGVSVTAIASRALERAEALSRAVAGSRAVSLDQAGSAAPTIFLAVSDNAIEAACSAVNASAGALVSHVSGSRDVGALDQARARGAIVGSFHPLAAVSRARTVTPPTPEACAAIFRGAAFAIEGESEVWIRLAPLAQALGGRPFPIAAEDKPLYHLGASMLAAFAAGLSQIAWEQMRAAGATDLLASAGVAHLLHTVADNIAAAPSPAAAQTGPVARGDAEGLTRQERAARALSPAAHDLYRVHIAHNIELAERAGRIDARTAEHLAKALQDSGTMNEPGTR